MSISEYSDQPGHSSSLIRTFAVRFMSIATVRWTTKTLLRQIGVFAGRTYYFVGVVMLRLILVPFRIFCRRMIFPEVEVDLPPTDEAPPHRLYLQLFSMTLSLDCQKRKIICAKWETPKGFKWTIIIIPYAQSCSFAFVYSLQYCARSFHPIFCMVNSRI